MEESRCFVGHIMGAAFSSGHRIVVGRWSASPMGGFSDIMWRKTDGTRHLIAPREEVAEFVSRHYYFDEVHLDAVDVTRHADRISVRSESHELELHLDLRRRGLASMLLGLQPAALATDPRWISLADTLVRPVVRPLLSGEVRLTGRTRAGSREWYAIHDVRTATARASSGGEDAGPTGWCPPARFGFSEFLDRPAVVRVTSLFERS